MRGTVVVTSWTSACISWPRCLPVASKGHPGLLLDDELARAVRTESAAAVRYWWGVSHGVVERWRKFLDVDRVNNAGTHRLIWASAQAGAEAVKAKEWTDAERETARELAKRLDLRRYLRPGYHSPRWTAAQKKLRGKLPYEEVARERSSWHSTFRRGERTHAGGPQMGGAMHTTVRRGLIALLTLAVLEILLWLYQVPIHPPPIHAYGGGWQGWFFWFRDFVGL
jgi:hypothetical protein